ncbi:histidine kinase [Sphingomonas antarctica]|uniref:histidine kinase n=1 Tax=Sphingomonas antarctica TaxID=2040274 RepID=UPI0039ED72F5
MGRFLAGVAATLVLVTAGLFLWNARADRRSPIPAAPQSLAATGSGVELAPPPEASEKTREEKRFARYDKDRDGAVAQGEYLAGRRKGFDKLDLNHDGRLSFEEYAVKGVQKFAAADKDKNSKLNAAEFASIRVVRKAKPKHDCPPTRQPAEEES